MKQLIVAASLAAVAATHSAPGGNHRAGARQGERRHHHQDRVRAAAGGRAAQPPELAQASAGQRRAAAGDRRVTPDLILDAVDELLLVQRGRESGYALGDEQFTQHRREHQEVQQPRGRSPLQGSAEAGRADAWPTCGGISSGQMLVSAGHTRRDDGEDQHQRRRSAGLLRAAPHRVHVAVRGHAARNPDRSARPPTAASTSRRTTRRGPRPKTLRKRLLAGEPFPRLAARGFRAPSKANGGLIGPIHSDELAPQLQATCWQSMNVGDITGVASHAARLPDSQARVADRLEGEDASKKPAATSATGSASRRCAASVRSISSSCASRRRSCGATTS